MPLIEIIIDHNTLCSLPPAVICVSDGQSSLWLQGQNVFQGFYLQSSLLTFNIEMK